MSKIDPTAAEAQALRVVCDNKALKVDKETLVDGVLNIVKLLQELVRPHREVGKISVEEFIKGGEPIKVDLLINAHLKDREPLIDFPLETTNQDLEGE